MRAALGIFFLVLVQASMGGQAQKQLARARLAALAVQPPPTAAQEVQQYKQATEGLVQQPRVLPDEQ